MFLLAIGSGERTGKNGDHRSIRVRQSVAAVVFAVLLVTSTVPGASVAALPSTAAHGTGAATDDAPTLSGVVSAQRGWVTAGHDPSRSGHNANTTGPKTAPNARWRYEFTNDPDEVPVVVSDGRVFVDGRDTLRAVDNETGALLWNVTGVEFDTVSVAADGTVVGIEHGYSGEIRAYDPVDGTERWNVTDFDSDTSVVSEGTVYLTRGGYLYAYDLQTGTQEWYSSTYVSEYVGLSAAGDTIYATASSSSNTRDYTVYALNASDARVRWQFDVEGVVSMRPVVANGSVFVGGGTATYDPRFYRLNATDGYVEWVYDVNARPRSAAVADGSVYVAAGNTVRALDAETGARLWRQRLSGSLDYGLSYTGMYALSPAVADGVVYAANDRGHLVALDGATGAEQWQYLLEGQATAPAVADGRVYVAAMESPSVGDDVTRVYALEEPPFAFSSYSVAAGAVAPGEQLSASVTVGNVDDETRSYNLSLYADAPFPGDGRALDRTNGTLNPGETATVTFTTRLNTSGTWNLSVRRDLETTDAVEPATVDVVHGSRVDEWPQIGFDAGRTRANPATAGPTQHVQEVWNLTNFDGSVQPAIGGGTVVVVHDRNADGEWADLLRAYDESSGALLWEFNVSARDRRVAGSPTVVDETVYLYATPYNYDGGDPPVYGASMFALHAGNGTAKWTRHLSMNASVNVDQAPVVDDGLVFVAGGRADDRDDVNASVLALNAADGSTAWRYDVNGAGTEERFNWVTIENGTAVAALYDRTEPYSYDYEERLIAIDTANGNSVWSTSNLNIDMNRPPVVRDGVVYVVNQTSQTDGDPIEEVRALSLVAGSDHWTFRPPDVEPSDGGWDVSSPVVTADAVFVHQMTDGGGLDYNTNRLYRLDPASGEIEWNRTVPDVLTMFAVDGLVYAGDYGGDYTYVYDAATGEYYGDLDLLSRGHGTAQAVANGTLITHADSTTPNDFRVIREGGVIEYTDLTVDSHVVGEDENVTVTATVTNVGAYARAYDVNLMVAPDDSYSNHYIWDYANREGYLAPGERTTITWTVELRERGDIVFTLQPSNNPDSMNRYMYDRAGSATVHVGDTGDGAVVNLGGPRDLEPDAASWPTTGHDAGNTGANAGTEAPSAVGSGVLNWSVNHTYEWTSAPTIADGTVYVGGLDDSGVESVFAYNRTDGDLEWQYPTIGSSDVEVAPTYAGGYLYAGASDGRVYQLDAATGEFVWAYDAGDVGGITVVDNVAYVTGENSTDDVLYALDATTREVLWTYGKPSTGYGMSGPAVESGVVYVTHDGQGTYAVDAATGTEVWSRAIAGSSSRLHSPVVEAGVVYVDDTTYSSTDARIYALAAADGTTRWSTPANVDGYTGSSPALANDTLYFTADGALRAVNASSGNPRWNTSICTAAEHSPAYAGGVVYVPTTDSAIRAYDADTGDLVWRYDAYSYEAFSPAVVGGTLYATGLENADYTYSLLALDGGPTAQSGSLLDYSGLSVSSGDVSVGESLTVSATVENQGDAACGYDADLTVDGSVVDTTSGTVGTGYSDTDTVEFTHSFATAGTYDVSIAGLPPETVNVSGPEPEVTVSPTSYDFGDVNEGDYAYGGVWIYNVGQAPLAWTGTDITGSDATAFYTGSTTSATIQPGDQAYLSVNLHSTESGSKTATLEIYSNDSDERTVSVPLAATVVGPPEVEVSPTSHDFGTVEVGANASTNVTVSNVGGSPLSLDGAHLTGADATVYTVTAGGSATEISIGESRNVTVRFDPSSTATADATLEIATNDSDESTVTVPLTGAGSVTSVNRAPVAGADRYTVYEGEWLNVSAPGRLANDGDPDGDTFAASHHGDVDNGTLQYSAQDGSFAYRPDPGFTGTDSYVYRVQDEHGTYSSFATVTIEVLPEPNRAPEAIDDTYSVHAGEWLNVSAPGRLANDRDADGDTFGASHHGTPDHGTLQYSAQDGSFAYKPDPGFTGTDSYVYRVRDEHGAYSQFATVTVEVLPPRNRAPVVVDDHYTVAEGEWLNVSAPGRLANDWDPDGDTFGASHHGTPDHGTLQYSAQDGSLRYFPDPGFTGTDSYVYRVRDEHGAYSGWAVVTIEVTSGNRAPTVLPDHYATLQGEWLNVSAPGRLANDYDLDGDSFGASHHGDPDNGTLQYSAQDGSLEYLPDPGFTGTDSYVYRVRDEHGTYSSFGTTSIEVVDPAETAPVAVPDTYTVYEGEWLNVSAPGRLANDLDPNNDSFGASHHGDPDNGTLRYSAQDGSFAYRPDPGFTGTDSYVYRVRDANGEYSPFTTVTIEVLPDPNSTANRPPAAASDSYTVTEGEWLNVSAPGRLANDWDPDGDTFGASHHGDPDNGTLQYSAQDGSFAYRPDPGFTGTDSYVYRVRDEHGAYSGFETVTIEVVPSPDATGNRVPEAVDDRYTVYEGEWLNVSAPGRLANDRDADGDTFGASHHGTPDHGTLQWSSQDGSLRYLPDPGFTGTDSYVYRVRDEHGAYSSFATVTIEVLPDPNRAPVAVEDSYVVLQGETLTVEAPGRLANDYDPDNDTFAASHHGTPDHGTLQYSAQDGSLEYVPDPGFTGTDTYVYRVQDEHGAYSGFATVTITVVEASTAGFADVAVAQDRVDFGSVPAGTNATAVVTVANVGDENLTVSGVTLSGPDAGSYAVTAGNATTVLGYGGTHDVIAEYAPGALGTANATLTVHSDDPDEPAVDVPLSGESYDGDAPTVDAVTVTGSYVDSADPNAPVVYENESVDVVAAVTDAFGTVDSVTVSLEAVDGSGSTTRYAAEDGTTGDWTTSVDLSTLSEGRYDVIVGVRDNHGNTRTVTAAAQVVADRSAPRFAAGVTRLDATTANVTITPSETIRSGTLTVEVEHPDGTTESVTTTDAGGGWNGTFAVPADGRYTITASGTDRAGNRGSDTATTRLATRSTDANNTITVEMQPSGLFVRYRTTRSVNDTFVTMTATKVPVGPLVRGEKGVQFLDAALGTRLDENLSYAVVGVPVNKSLLPSGTDVGDVSFLYYNETTGVWTTLPTTVEDVTVDGTSDRYWVTKVTHFSTYGAVADDVAPPTITGTDPVDGHTFPSGTTTETLRVEYDDAFSGVDASETVVLFDGSLVNDASATTITDQYVTYQATGLTDGSTHELEVTVLDEAGNAAAETVRFSVDSSESSGGGGSTSPPPSGGGDSGNDGDADGGGGGAPDTDDDTVVTTTAGPAGSTQTTTTPESTQTTATPESTQTTASPEVTQTTATAETTATPQPTTVEPNTTTSDVSVPLGPTPAVLAVVLAALLGALLVRRRD
jgi:outer membrane protein assembly factor BamB